ncbi:MAG: sugar O-acyltransferase, sialic acid O-acetyltransferase NeuD family [Phycisphaerales bacterium]|nr:sugar O-acyltransferase, sialic acid O-acetyltransferase NeuD family [Phycisphaerales bacterium]
MDIVLIGCGGHGKVVLDAVRQEGRHRVVGFLDADPATHGTTVHDVPVLGGPNLLDKMAARKVRGVIVAIGDNRTRFGYASEAEAAGLELVSAVHPRAVIAPSATLGRNVVVAAGAVVSVDASVGDGSIINTGAIVDHECIVGRHVHIAPGVRLAGRVAVGDFAFVGLGAMVIQCLTIGERATVGAGAMVRTDVGPGITVVGVPARPILRSV